MLYSHKTFRCGLVNKMISQHELHKKYCVHQYVDAVLVLTIDVIIEELHCWHVVCGVQQSRWRCYRSSPTLHGEQYLNINQICVDAPLTHDQQTPDFSRLYNEVLHVGRLTILKTMDWSQCQLLLHQISHTLVLLLWIQGSELPDQECSKQRKSSVSNNHFIPLSHGPADIHIASM